MRDLTHSVHIISRLTHNFYARELKRLGISMGEFPFLIEISAHGGISQEKLSEIVMVSKSVTASIVQSLIAKKLILRKINKNDSRAYCLWVTGKGQKLIPAIQKILNGCHAGITDRLTRIESDVLVNLLNKVADRSIEQLNRKSSGKSECASE